MMKYGESTEKGDVTGAMWVRKR